MHNIRCTNTALQAIERVVPRGIKSAVIPAAAVFILTLNACGSSVESARKFCPNKPPVIGTVTAVVASTGAVVTKDTALTSGMELAVTVQGYDPEGKLLTWSADSEYGYPRDEEITATGYRFTFVVQNITANTDAPVQIRAVDEKKAGAGTTFLPGKGLQPATVTLASTGNTAIAPADTAELDFTTDHDGYFEIFIDNSAATVTAMRSSNRTVCAPGSRQLTVKGPASSAAADLTLAAGVNRIWAAFIDINGTVSSAYCEILVDADAPLLVSSNPADGGTCVSQKPVIELTFSKEIDPASLAESVTVSGGGIEQTAQLLSSSGASAVFTVAERFPILTACTVSVKGAKDTLGNTMIPASFSFTTAAGYVVSYLANGGTGTPPANETFAEGDTVIVAAQGPLSRTGYTFTGWNTAEDGSGIRYSADSTVTSEQQFAMPAEDVILYAQWEKKTLTALTICAAGVPVTSFAMLLGQTIQLTVSFTPEDVISPSVTWGSSSAAVSVDENGRVTAKAQGAGSISVTSSDGSVVGYCTVLAGTITVPKAVKISIGQSCGISVQKTIRKFPSYISSDESIVTKEVVSTSVGTDIVQLTAHAPGTAYVSMLCDGILLSFPVTVTTVKTMSAGGVHSLIVRSDGTLWGCGANDPNYYAVGITQTGNITTPARIGSLTRIASVSAGNLHSLAVTEEGAVYSWGFNTFGSTGVGTAENPIIQPTRIPQLESTTAAAAGYLHSIILSTSGNPYDCGSNSDGQLGRGVQQNYPNFGKVSLFSDICAVAAGSNHTLMIDRLRTLYTCGYNSSGQLGLGDFLSRVSFSAVTLPGDTSGAVFVSGGNGHSLVLTADGVLYSFGGNSMGQLGNGTDENSSSPEAITEVYNNDSSETSALGPVRSMSAGNYHSLIITRSGRIYGCGSNYQGQLATTAYGSITLPTEIIYAQNRGSSELRNIKGSVVSAAAGANFSLIKTSDGRLYGCGRNFSGQLGQGSSGSASYSTPVEIVLPEEVEW